MSYNKFMRYVLTFEAIVLNAGTGIMCLIAPSFFASQFSSNEMPAAALEFIRWYGVLLWVLAFYVLRILPANDNRILAPAVEALLFGDLVHLFAIYMFYRAVPVWSYSFIAMLVFTIGLAGIRSIWVFRYHQQKIAKRRESASL